MQFCEPPAARIVPKIGPDVRRAFLWNTQRNETPWSSGAFALFAFTAVVLMAVAPAAGQSVAAEETVAFAVENMTCALCPVTVQKAMEGVQGVHAVEIDLDARTGTAMFDAAATNADAIATASANAGYPAHVGN